MLSFWHDHNSKIRIQCKGCCLPTFLNPCDNGQTTPALHPVTSVASRYQSRISTRTSCRCSYCCS